MSIYSRRGLGFRAWATSRTARAQGGLVAGRRSCLGAPACAALQRRGPSCRAAPLQTMPKCRRSPARRRHATRSCYGGTKQAHPLGRLPHGSQGLLAAGACSAHLRGHRPECRPQPLPCEAQRRLHGAPVDHLSLPGAHSAPLQPLPAPSVRPRRLTNAWKPHSRPPSIVVSPLCSQLAGPPAAKRGGGLPAWGPWPAPSPAWGALACPLTCLGALACPLT